MTIGNNTLFKKKKIFLNVQVSIITSEASRQDEVIIESQFEVSVTCRLDTPL